MRPVATVDVADAARAGARRRLVSFALPPTADELVPSPLGHVYAACDVGELPFEDGGVAGTALPPPPPPPQAVSASVATASIPNDLFNVFFPQDIVRSSE